MNPKPPEVDSHQITRSVRELIAYIGDDPDREGLRETPDRVARAWKEWASGYGVDPASVLKTFEDGAHGYDTLVFQGAIALQSLCEHHLAPFSGYAHIAYIPNGRIVGLSKLARLVEIFSRRLQVQERLTCQIADALVEHLKPKGVGVLLRCRHGCIESRGIKKIGTITMTSALRGAIKAEPEARNEFLKLVDLAETGVRTI